MFVILDTIYLTPVVSKEHLALLIALDKLMELVFAMQDYQAIMEYAQNAPLELYGALLQTNVYLFVAKTLFSMHQVMLAIAFPLMACFKEFANNAQPTIFFQTDIVLLVQLHQHIALNLNNVIAMLDIKLVHQEFASLNAVLTKYLIKPHKLVNALQD